MADIKTRDATRGSIKMLDRAASSMHRMKDQTIRCISMETISHRDNDNLSSYAQDETEHYAGSSAIYAAKAGMEMAIRSRQKTQEIAEVSQNNEDRIHPSFRELGIKMIRSRQSRMKMADAEVIINSEEYRYGDHILKADSIRHRGQFSRSNSVVAGNRHKSLKAASISSTATQRQKEYGRRKLIRKMMNPGRRTITGKGSVHSTRKAVDRLITATRDLAKRANALFTSLYAGGAAILLIVFLIMLFGAALTMADDGNRVVGIGNNAIVEVARAELGNTGGEKYWKWYGFRSRVDWCAIFCSWCADQCGYIESGTLPKFSIVGDGENWFKNRHRWAGKGYSPRPGDFIFFDYERDGVLDHVGIVENCDGEAITTIEGNSGDSCKRQSYIVGSSLIAGYGLSVSMTSITFEKASVWAKMIADDNSYHYVRYSGGDLETHECPVCNSHPKGKYRGWNCIGFAFACWKHGAGINCRCSCDVINNGHWNQLLNCKTDSEADRLATRLVGVPCKVIRNGGDAIPFGKLKQGDVIALFNRGGYYHTMFYEGNGRAADCTSGRKDNIQSNNVMSQSTKSKIKIAIRYGA